MVLDDENPQWHNGFRACEGGRVPHSAGLKGTGRGHSHRGDSEAGQFDGPPPEWILIQRSALPQFSDVPAAITQLLAERYRLVKAFPSGDDRPRVYDWQDAFFLPLVGLEGIERPGPAFELYTKKDQLSRR